MKPEGPDGCFPNAVSLPIDPKRAFVNAWMRQHPGAFVDDLVAIAAEHATPADYFADAAGHFTDPAMPALMRFFGEKMQRTLNGDEAALFMPWSG